MLAHRDINTHNILVRSDLSCVITDLGFAVATMGSKLIKRGHPEIAEQTSLTDVNILLLMFCTFLMSLWPDLCMLRKCCICCSFQYFLNCINLPFLEPFYVLLSFCEHGFLDSLISQT